MAVEIFMPKLGMTMEKGTILQWFKEEGEPVKAGELLFEVMTDKINIEVEANDSGILLKKYYGTDEEVPVNEVIGYIGEAGEQVPDEPPRRSGVVSDEKPMAEEQPVSNASGSQQADSLDMKPRATPAARKLAREHGIDLHKVKGSGAKGRIHRVDVEKYLEANTPPKATPLARRVAQKQNIDLVSVTGTGIQGKIMRDDVLKHQQSQARSEADTTLEKGKEKIKVQGIRKIVGQRMVESAFTAPHVTLMSEVDMSFSMQLREQLLPEIEKQTGYRLSYTEIIMKAVAYALTKHRMVNASLDGENIVLNPHVNIGLAVSVPNGLLVPVVKNADKKGLAVLTEECKTLARLARESKLTPDQITGGTFTISNLGMYAVDAFTPIINRPETAILGVGRIHEKPVGVNGAIELRPMMGLSLSFDHRVIDGAPAAAFLTELKNILENPFKLLV